MLVKKYGGSALATPQHISTIAAEIAKAYKARPEPTIIVVSAMGESTNQLLKMGHDLSVTAPGRELDMLISAGERISMALMSIALQSQGCPAISFTGSQAGILTSSKHGYASIKEIKPIRIDAELKKNKIIVIAGFQGVDPLTKEVTTLGRGGTDTTAVALAAYYKARSCELYKDTPGILNAPPKVLNQCHLISEIHYDELLSLCYWGSKVVQHRAVELAKRFEVPLKIGSWKDHSIGTIVVSKKVHMENLAIELETRKDKPMESVLINNISLFEPILTVGWKLPLPEALIQLMEVSQAHDLPYPTLVASTEAPEQSSRLMLTGHQDWIFKYVEAFKTETHVDFCDQHHFGALVQGYGLENGSALVELIQSMKKEDIKLSKVLKESQGILFSFPYSEKEKVLAFMQKSLNQKLNAPKIN